VLYSKVFPFYSSSVSSLVSKTGAFVTAYIISCYRLENLCVLYTSLSKGTELY
jgi:hypothetical protein